MSENLLWAELMAIIRKLIKDELKVFRPNLTQTTGSLPPTQLPPASGSTSGGVTLYGSAPEDVTSGSGSAGSSSSASRGDHVHHGAFAPTNATYITQTSNSTLSAEQELSSLSTGLVKVTTGTGVLSTATGGTDYANASHTHAAGDVTSGTMATARLGSGTANGTTFLRGDQTWATPSGGAALADGDYGDVTVSGSGTVMTIDTDVVTLAKLLNIATDSLIGRDTAGTGDPEVIGLGGGVEMTGAGILQRSALTGDATAAAGSGAVAVVKIQGVSVDTTAPTSGQVLAYDSGSAKYIPTTVGSGGVGAPTDATYIVEDANASLSVEVVLGQTVITTSTYAGRQSAAKAGRIFLPSNSFYLERDTGSAWTPWGPIFPMTPPVDGDFAWVNQGGATVSTTNGGIHLAIGSASGNNLRMRKKSAPSTPYTITAGFIPLITTTSSPLVGIGWRQSSDGKVVTFHFTNNGGGVTHYGITKWSSATTVSANYVAATNADYLLCGSVVWFRIADDGTNRTCHVSRDKQNWLQLHTVGRTDFLTADEILFFVTNGGGTSSAAMTLVSWEQA